VKNGLPTFHLHYSNDDDAERRGGRDSWLAFTAPEEGAYVVRVADSSGRGGERFTYRLIVREPDPGFEITLDGGQPTALARKRAEFHRARGSSGTVFQEKFASILAEFLPGFPFRRP
jgi:hypothetical protein